MKRMHPQREESFIASLTPQCEQQQGEYLEICAQAREVF